MRNAYLDVKIGVDRAANGPSKFGAQNYAVKVGAPFGALEACNTTGLVTEDSAFPAAAALAVCAKASREVLS